MNWLNGIVSILTADSKTITGTGFVVASRLEKETLIVTCTHVLDEAGYTFKNDEAVKVRFQANGHKLTAYLVKDWSKLSVDEDVAVLYLTDPIPEGVEKLPLVAAAICQHQIPSPKAYGYPSATKGQLGKGKLLGLIPDPEKDLPYPVAQLRSSEITWGYSGGPVWSFHFEAVLGMVRSGAKPDGIGRQRETAYATTSETLVKLCSELQLQILFKKPPRPRNQRFLGREDELEELHQTLRNNTETFSTPVGITGLGGIGKTELVVEYVYRHRDADTYPDGVFWLNGSNPLSQELAELAVFLHPELRGQSQEIQLKHVANDLFEWDDYLLILDNLADANLLKQKLPNEKSLDQIPGYMLFTTRQRQRKQYQGIELVHLSKSASLKLLLSFRKDILLFSHPEHDIAKRICYVVGYLPLALQLIAAYLGEYPEVSLVDYANRLNRRGSLTTLIMSEKLLKEDDVDFVSVGMVLQTQWAAIKTEEAKLLLQTAGQLPEGAQITIDLLGILAGVVDEFESGEPSVLARALKQLMKSSLVESLQENSLRLHPLVRDFVRTQTSYDEPSTFREKCATRLSTAYSHFLHFAEQYEKRGIYNLQNDLATGIYLAYSANRGPITESQSVLIHHLMTLFLLLQKETNNLSPPKNRDALIQQLAYRLIEIGQPLLWDNDEVFKQRTSPMFIQTRWLGRRDSVFLMRTLLGQHEGKSGIKAVTVTNDGLKVISGSYDHKLKVWDLITGKNEVILEGTEGHTQGILSIAVTSDGQRVISTSLDKTLKIWNLQTGQFEKSLLGHLEAVEAVAVIPNSEKIVSASDDQTLMVWNLLTGHVEKQLIGHSDWVVTVAVTPDGRKIISGSLDKTIRVWDLITKEEYILAEHLSPVWAVAVTMDGKEVISASDDCTVRVWNLETGKQVRIFEGHTDGVQMIKPLPDGERVISASHDRTLIVWNLRTGQQEQRFEGHSAGVRDVAIALNGLMAVSASDDDTLRLWSLNQTQKEREFAGHTKHVLRVVMTSDNMKAISASDDGTLKIWNVLTGNEEKTLNGYCRNPQSIAVFPKEQKLIYGLVDHSIKIWNLIDEHDEHNLIGHSSNIEAITLTQNGQRAISISDDATGMVWNLQDFQWERSFRGHSSAVQTVAIVPNEQKVISVSYDLTLKVWNLITGLEEFLLERLSSVAHTLVVTEDKTKAIVAFGDNSIKAWNLQTGEEIWSSTAVTTEPNNRIHKVVLTPDSRKAITVSSDQTVKVLDLVTGQVDPLLLPNLGNVNDLVVTPDGQKIVSIAGDNSLRVWSLHSRENLASVILDQALSCISMALNGKTIVIGDISGSVYCMELSETS